MPENEQSIEVLQKRYNKLQERKITAGANLDNAKKQLEKLKKQAVAEYGTDDVEELRKKLEEMKAENERKRREYQSSLDTIDAELKKVDEEFAAAREAKDEGETQ